MTEKKRHIEKNVNAELGGMRLYGTTSNVEVEGYEMSGDIENAGQLDKGFKRNKDREGETADFITDELPDQKNDRGGYVLDHPDDQDTESRRPRHTGK
ncbi:hypothetical protein K8O68_03915 [Salipaludibacillus sp. CUR1]|uniref:hypothetical protein n=1 Tax=Salipaludibacillus sp. CUR1 TaxID=2820003 RepID=UPI001E33BBA4|nr:hypothetical protein [Salipaludibacillus sp. CUR1]MCE7791572.1 hypothetical protein [Salipaludibacillus sp. CUR1]